ncbi:TetR/AcrR family transcriptional regulator [Frankia sp. CNm7]|uniref:TetR/AcrR family transcriptional regulator n=1 Tax=Frankia nepalensis TaxID=1836974 RepID=A0A937RNC8_9ACTN|nr:TetR/AcrR family transcriptional regulator [Frankia nepalensis]MBL7499057.1 TetR/AcrR family transcriptional regulator [Frankia nepalensis]MBL7514503.1 TetR/AcrR family transcriptional regulator [Frankia nepalensis]MBL7520541.1 TetR/AcrR family transcriptional regulator [Frankia nepalensis]MBL7632035.1 TetR/AcrR family transcriptional regulator [Frankia nepalensis]
MASSSTSARRSGRPTSAEAARLDTALKEAALRLFLERGYEATSLDEIAALAGTTKQSLYARFRSKQELFATVLSWATERPDWPIPEPGEVSLPANLEAALLAVAESAVRRVLDPRMVALTRLAIAQADRFPEVARRTYRMWPRQKAVANLLREHAASGTIQVNDADLAAEHFLGMVAVTPARMASFGIQHSPEEQRRRVEDAVRLFLRALRPD